MRTQTHNQNQRYQNLNKCNIRQQLFATDAIYSLPIPISIICKSNKKNNRKQIDTTRIDAVTVWIEHYHCN